MKKQIPTFIASFFFIVNCSNAQFSHSVNIEYNIPFYFDKMPYKKNSYGGINYRALYKNVGVETFFKFIEIGYEKDNIYNYKAVPDSTLFLRSSAIFGINATYKWRIINEQLYCYPALGIGYMVAYDQYLQTYTFVGEPVLKRYRISRFVSNIGLKIEKLLLQKINLYAATYYYRSRKPDSQQHILTIDVGFGYNINRYKKNNK